MNKITICGRLTKDPEISVTPSNKELSRFSIACNRLRKNEADFFSCIAWGEQGKTIAKYCHKGSQLLIVGSMQSRAYDRKDGSKALIWEVNVEEFEFLGKPEKPKEEQNNDSKVMEESELPL